MRTIVLALLILTTCGCGPLALQHGARTVPKGKVAAGASALVVHEIGQGEAKDSSRTDAGQSAAFVRWGFHEQIDAGLQVYPGGLRSDVKLEITDKDGIAVALSPGLHLGYFSQSSDDDGGDTSQTAMLTGLDFTIVVAKTFGDTEVWAAPRFGTFNLDSKYEENFGGDSFESDSTITHRGWGIGFGAKLRATDTLWIVPELGIYQRETQDSGFTDRGLSWVPAVGFATGF